MKESPRMEKMNEPMVIARTMNPFQRNTLKAPIEKQEFQPVITRPEPAAPNGEPPVRHGQSRWLKKTLVSALAAAVLLTLGAGGYQWYRYLTTHEETDDAYTTGHLHAISSRINDTVENVLVDDNEHVKAGQTLVLLDPRDYQVRVDQALASLAVAQRQAEAAKLSIQLSSVSAAGRSTEAEGNVSNAQSAISKALAAVSEAKSAIPQAHAELGQKKAEEERASKDFARFDQLANEGAVSMQQRDQAWRDFQVARDAVKSAQESERMAVARLEQADQTVLAARAQLVQSKGIVEQAQAQHVQTEVNSSQFEVAQAAIKQAKTQLDEARLQLSYTRIVAPIDGRVGKKTVEEGQRVQPGQQLMAVVSDNVWVVANFKETQLERMRNGQKVDVKIDSFPHHKFSGVVDSVSPGSGASFALLPPDNATGNFTKIVQRVPVKVVLDRQSTRGYEALLVPGMSAVVTVSVSR